MRPLFFLALAALSFPLPVETRAGQRAVVVYRGIEYAESDRPYRFGERPLDRYSDDLLAAIEKYRLLTDCFPGEPVYAIDPSSFDWMSFRTNEELSVCLFKLFDTIGDRDVVKAWLDEQGFRTGWMEVSRSIGGVLLSAVWVPSPQLKFVTGSLPEKLLSFTIISQVIAMRWDKYENLSLVSLSNTRK